MAFNTQEQEILKWGVANGKSRQEVEEAISNFRSGIVPQKVQPVEQPSLVSKLGERAKTFGKEAVTLGTLGASTMTPQDFNATGQDRSLAALQGLNRAGQSPIRMAGAVGGAIGDVVGAGLEATGLDKPIGQVLAPIAESQPVQKAMEVFKSLPQETQEVLGAIVNTANIPISGAGLGVAKNVAQKTLSKVDDIKNVVPKNLGQKAVDLVSADPEAKVATILQRSTPEDVSFYTNLGQKASVSGEALTPFEYVGNKLAETTKTLEGKLKEIGKAKSDIVAPMREGLSSFSKETKPLIEKLTSLKNSFSEIDASSKSVVQSIINDAKTVSTKLDADRFIDKVQDALYTGNRNMTIVQGSTVDKQLRGIIGEYNASLKKALPKEYGELNTRYSEMIDTLSAINRSLGEVVEGTPIRGAGLIKQYFSPSGSKAKEIFEFVKRETDGAVDLAKDATLAKFAMELFDDPRARSLLQGIGDVPTTLTGVVTKVAEKLGGDKLREGMRESTIRKAKEITSPKSEVKSGSPTINKAKSKSVPSTNSTTKEGVVNELINNPLRGSVTPSEFLPKKKVGSESTSLYHGTENTDITNFIPSKTGDLGSGVYLTRDKNTALRFSDPSFRNSSLEPKGNGEYVNINTGETYKPPKPGVIDINGSNLKIYKIKPGEIQDEISKLRDPKTKVLPVGYENMVQQKFKKMGYDGIEVTGTPRGENDQVLIFPESVNKLKINKSISPLEQEAKKYKSAEEFVFNKKTSTVKNLLKGETLTEDIPLYHGSGGSHRANETFVRGKYFTPSVEDALNYTWKKETKDVEASILRKGAKVFDLDNLKNPNQKIVPMDVMVDPLKLSNFLKEKGYVATRNTNNGFEEIVRLDERTNSKWFGKPNADVANPDLSGYEKAPEWMKDSRMRFLKEQQFIENAKNSELTKSQLTDIWKKANKK